MEYGLEGRHRYPLIADLFRNSAAAWQKEVVFRKATKAGGVILIIDY